VDFDLKNRRIIDVQNIFHKMEPRTLRAAYKFYCYKEHVGAHSAEADTIATLEVLKAQLDKYQNEPYIDADGNSSFPIQNDVEALSRFSFYNRYADLAATSSSMTREKRSSISENTKDVSWRKYFRLNHSITTG